MIVLRLLKVSICCFSSKYKRLISVESAESVSAPRQAIDDVLPGEPNGSILAAVSETKRMAVIGGGAAGFFGAIRGAEVNPSAEVVLIESTHEPLDKVRISGGGRCNVTHHCFDPAELVSGYPRGFRELRGAFSRFQPKDTVEWFEARGIRLKTESDGRMFPVSDSSVTIIECLMKAVQDAGVRLIVGDRVTSVERREGNSLTGRFRISTHSGSQIDAHGILLATGSSAAGHRFAENLGHTIVPCVPSLFTFKVIDTRLSELSGISVTEAHLFLRVEGKTFEQSGPLLITHWGLSGPAVLKLSAWAARELHDAHYRASLTIDWIPSHSEERLRKAVEAHRSRSGTRPILGHNPDVIPRRLWERLCQRAGIAETDIWSHLTKDQLESLLEELKAGEYQVAGKGQFKEEFVTCGGVNLKEVDFRTMESRICPHLYLAGEILDIDGITGGFNFQSAWTTAWIAGSHMGAGSAVT